MGRPDFGTEADGIKSKYYCRLCYDAGTFTANVTLDEISELAARDAAVTSGMAFEDARRMMRHILPLLKRWDRRRAA